jgi:hypothetical protein
VIVTTAALARAPRQLDIIADTVLAADPRMAVHTASSTVAKHTASSTVKRVRTRSDNDRLLARLARCIHPDIAAANKARQRLGHSHSAFCRTAGIELNNWHKLRRGEQQPSQVTLAKIRAALSQQKVVKPPNIIAGFHLLVVGLCADAVGEPREAVFTADMTRQRPQDPAWLRAARIQMMATYITAVELEVGNAELGRAIGQSRQAVQKSRNRIEDLRDDAAIDAALAQVTALVSVGER